MTWINPVALSLQIQALDGGRFAELINALLSETLARHGIDRSHLSTNLKITEPDGGIDARCVNTPTTVGRIFPRTTTFFQFKGGNQQRSASDIAREDILGHPNVAQALRNGHAFVYVAGWDRGEGFETNVRDLLRNEGLAIEESQFVFIGRDALSRFLLAFPALCGTLTGVESDLLDLDTWSQWKPFQNSFQTDARLAAQIEDIRARITEPRAIIRVVGSAGDGKTRMVLETLRTSQLAPSVLYAPQPSFLTPSLISYLARTPDARCTIVVDEVDDNEAEDLERRFSVMPPEVRLVVIGLDASGPAQQRTFQVEGLSEETLIRIIGTIVPGIADDSAKVIAHDCERSPKLAVLIAERIREDPSLLDPGRVLSDGIIRRALDRYLALDSSSIAWQALAATALVMRLGWLDTAENESAILFGALGMDPVAARRAVIELHDRFGIAPLAGRFRYVSPAILADHYAGHQLRAWTRDRLAHVISSFTPSMVDSFAQRLRRMVFLLENRSIIEEVVLGDQGPFRGLDDLGQSQMSSLLRHLAAPFPAASLHLLRRLILSASIEELRAASHIRRDLVWAIEQLLWPEQIFPDAAELLLRLAIAENETWANNATGLWIETFQMVLGRTAARATVRAQVLQRAASSQDPGARLLTARAIEAAHRMGNISRTGMPPDDVPNMPNQEWRPENWQEWATTITRYLGILELLLEDADQTVRLEAVKALAATVDAAMQLPGQVLEAWVPLVKKLRADPFERRVLVVKAIEQTLTAWHQQLDNSGEASADTVSSPISNLSEEHRQELHRRLGLLAALASNLRGEDFSSRFRLAVNQAIWDRRLGASVDDAEAAITLNLEPLAQEVIAQPILLEDEWAWLANSLEWRAAERWFEVLGRSDVQRTVAESLEHIATQMPKAISWRSLYELSFARSYRDEQYIDELLTSWIEYGESPPQVIDLLFRAGYSVERGRLLNQLVDNGAVSHLQPFAFGLWGRAIPVEAALQIATTAAAKVDTPQVVSFVRMYLFQVPDAHPLFRGLALQLLLSDHSLPTDSGTRNDWAELAELYVGDAPQPILAATLKRLVQDDTGRPDPLRAVITRAWEVGDKNQLFVDILGPALEESGMNGWRLRRVLSTLPLDDLPSETLLGWVAAHPERRATAAADFVGPPVGRPTNLQAELLEQFRVYGVGASFARNLLSGTWFGSGVEWVQKRIALVPEWLADDRPAVRAWGREIQEILEGELKRFQRWEDEERFE